MRGKHQLIQLGILLASLACIAEVDARDSAMSGRGYGMTVDSTVRRGKKVWRRTRGFVEIRSVGGRRSLRYELSVERPGRAKEPTVYRGKCMVGRARGRRLYLLCGSGRGGDPRSSTYRGPVAHRLRCEPTRVDVTRVTRAKRRIRRDALSCVGAPLVFRDVWSKRRNLVLPRAFGKLVRLRRLARIMGGVPRVKRYRWLEVAARSSRAPQRGARVELLRLVVQGSYPKARIRKALKPLLTQIARVHRVRSGARPRGRLVVRLILREHPGRVVAAKVIRSELNNPKVERRVSRILRRLRVMAGRKPIVSVLTVELRFS